MNRNRLLDLFASNLANVVVHKILEKAIDRPEIIDFYNQKHDVPPRLKSRGLKRHSCFGWSRNDHTLKGVVFCQVPWHKEVKNSFEIAKRYREKINPADKTLPVHDIRIREKIINKVKAELSLRIQKGYTNIDLSLVERLVDEYLKEFGIIWFRKLRVWRFMSVERKNKEKNKKENCWLVNLLLFELQVYELGLCRFYIHLRFFQNIQI